MARPRLATPNFQLRDRAGIWQVEWQADGKTNRISTRTRDRTSALGFLADFAAGYNSPAPPSRRTISDVLDGYLTDRKSRVASYGTLVSACAALRRHLGDLDPSSLTRERARWYADRRRSEGHWVGPPSRRTKKPTSDGTILREIVTLRAALKWAAQEKWIEVAPYVPGPTTPEPRSRWLSRDEFDRLLEAARAPHVRLFILLALHTGGRSGAILGLTWERIDLARRRIDLGSGKGNKGRASVPVNSDLHAALLEARKGATCPWVIEHGGKPVASIKTGFRAACARAGLAGRVTPHTLRHTAATWMAEDGIPMIQIARYLGHTTETTTTRVYAKFSPDYLRTAADSLVRRGS